MSLDPVLDPQYGVVENDDGTVSPVMPPKPKGRPTGSKNKPKLLPLRAEGLKGDDPIQISPSVAWVIGEPYPDVPQIEEHNGKGRSKDYDDTFSVVRLHSNEVPEGLEMVIDKWSIIGVSELPNGNASIVTNLGAAHPPLILVTAEPYVDIKKRLYPGLGSV